MENNIEPTIETQPVTPIDHHAHINFFSLLLGGLGVAVVAISVFTLGASDKNSAPSVVATRPTVTVQQYDKETTKATTMSVKVKETNAVMGFYSSVTILPE